MCLLELKGLQVVHCYHSAGELKTELTQLPLRITAAVSVAQRGGERRRKRERERNKNIQREQERMENIFKEKSPHLVDPELSEHLSSRGLQLTR